LNTENSENRKSAAGNIMAFLQLIRVPNLFTVPGDAAVGILAAGGAFISFEYLKTALILLGFYIFGLITNDIADYKVDLKERPDRPLPSGRISLKTAVITALLLLGGIFSLSAGFSRTFFLTEGFLLFMILAYNFFLKKNSVTGPFAISLCRVSGVILGFYAAGGQPDSRPFMLYVAAWCWFLYFLSLSLAAYYETDPQKAVRGAFMAFPIPVIWIVSAPVVSGALIPVVVMKEMNPLFAAGLISSGIFAVYLVKNVLVLNYFVEKPSDISESIGELIWNIMFLQASACAFSGNLYAAVFILLLTLPAKITARKFYAS
jgi:4-hydroxybenzoate polyprenyltransferase